MALNIIESTLENEMEEGFINYARELIENRSIPSVYDGLKPVQRRILFAMNELNLQKNKPTKKSARIVGEVLGKYHPHGDSSVYEAMIRLSQPWTMRYPLIEGQGNIGSIDGDSPAAMRYTEVRLESLVQEFVKDLNKNCIEWVNNFDDSLKEPSVFPTLFPNYLVNGGTGIAVGVSCDIPPHNLKEVINGIIAYIDNPNISIKELMKYIKGPDFPTGGVLEGENLANIYSKGSGTFKVRGKYRIEKGKYGKNLIKIIEIPYMTTKNKIISQIAQLYIDKKLDGVIDIRDETDLENGISIVIEVKKDVDPNYIIKKIFKKTNLEVTQKVNMRAVIDGKLRLLKLTDYIQEYLLFQKDILIKKTKYEISKYEEELHMINGYLKCLSDIDKVIDIITRSRKAETAKKELMKEFKIDDIQANAILELKLRRLTSLEIKQLKERKKYIDGEIKELKNIILNDTNIYCKIKKELLEISKQYGDERRTKIQKNFKKIEAEKPIVTFYVTIKDKNIKTYQTKNFKYDGDILIETNNHEELILFTKNGDYYKYNNEEIPNKLPLSIVGAFATNFEDEGDNLIIVTKQGLVKKSKIQDYDINRKNSKAIKLEDKDEVIAVFKDNDKNPLNLIIMSTESNYTLFKSDEINITGRNTKGSMVFKFKKKENIKHVFNFDEISKLNIYTDTKKTKTYSANILPFVSFGHKKMLKRGLKINEKITNVEVIKKDSF